MLCERLGLILRKIALSLTLRPHYYYYLLKILDSFTHYQYVKKEKEKNDGLHCHRLVLMSRVIRDNSSKWFSLNRLCTVITINMSVPLILRLDTES